MAGTYLIKDRKKTVSKNVSINVLSKIVGLLIGFVTRKLLLTFIAVEYLGLTSLFVNVLDLLNLAELGIGVALQVRLYKPLVNDDKEKIGNLLSLARKIYGTIAAIVVVVGLITAIFLPYIIKENPFDDWYVRWAFLISVGGIALSYLCADKRLFFEANESLYIATLSDIFARILTSVVALVALFLSVRVMDFPQGGFLIYLAITYLATFLSNVSMFLLFKRRHGVEYNVDKSFQKEELSVVKKNLKDVIPNKLSVFIFTSTDSIVITIFIGLTMVAIYSNYMTIMMAFLLMSAIASNGLVSTFGKMIKEGKDKEYIYEKFQKYELLQFMFSSFTAICVFCLINKFVIAWVGSEYLLSFWPVFLLSLDYLIHSLFQPMSTLFTSTEKFKEDKIVSLTSAGINIGVSILLSFFMGVEGVILGTFISNVFTYVMRVRLIYKSYFNRSMIKRLLLGLLQVAVTAGLCALCYLVVKQINFSNAWVDFIVSAVVMLVMSNAFNFVIGGYFIMKNKKETVKRTLKKRFPRTMRYFASRSSIKANKNRKPVINEHLRVGFICQCEHIFDKTKPVVEEFIARGYEVVLYIVKDPDSKYEAQTIFEKEFPALCIKEEEKPLSELNLNYVFYSRPYNNYLPEHLASGVVVNYAKTCYIPYGYSLMELGSVNLNSNFVRNINFLFADNRYTYDFADKVNSKGLKKYNHLYDIGYPYFDSLLNNLDSFTGEAHDCFKPFKKNRFNVMWAPRWSNDDAIGGSNFLRYWKEFNSLLVNNDKYNYVFRPHPYALSYYVDNNLITQEERDDYLKTIESSNNACYDHNSDYFATFNSSNVLVCDISSIIAEYLFLNKPIIFCHNEGKEILNSIALEMCEIFYNAYSFEDIQKYLEDLSNGVDPLKEKREQYINKYIKQFTGSTKRIVDVIVEDYEGDKKNG